MTSAFAIVSLRSGEATKSLAFLVLIGKCPLVAQSRHAHSR